jgi:hypothetical protein
MGKNVTLAAQAHERRTIVDEAIKILIKYVGEKVL